MHSVEQICLFPHAPPSFVSNYIYILFKRGMKKKSPLFISRVMFSVENFFCEIRFRMKTTVCVDNLFLNLNLR